MSHFDVRSVPVVAIESATSNHPPNNSVLSFDLGNGRESAFETKIGLEQADDLQRLLRHILVNLAPSSW